MYRAPPATVPGRVCLPAPPHISTRVHGQMHMDSMNQLVTRFFIDSHAPLGTWGGSLPCTSTAAFAHARQPNDVLPGPSMRCMSRSCAVLWLMSRGTLSSSTANRAAARGSCQCATCIAKWMCEKRTHAKLARMMRKGAREGRPCALTTGVCAREASARTVGELAA